MAQALANKTIAAPWLARWTAASADLGSVTVDVAPVILPDSVLAGPLLTLVFAAAPAASNPEWHLLIEDVTLRSVAAGAAADPSVVSIISAISATTPTARETSRDGTTSDIFVHVPIQFYLRGIPRGSEMRAYIALAFLGGATAAYLLSYASDGRAL